MKKKFLATILTISTAFSLITGCSKDSKTESSASDSQSVETKDENAENKDANAEESASNDDAKSSEENVTGAVPSKDLAGNDIKVPEEVTTIVSMAPSTTRLLVDLGLGDKIVACDTYSQQYYGTELSKDIPAYDMMAPDQEAIVALSPDIIFTTGMSYSKGEDVYSSVRDSGVCLADIPTATSIKEIEDSIEFIGNCTGKSTEAEKIVKDMSDAISEISEKAKSISDSDKKSVLYELSTPTPDYPSIYSAGKGTYIDEIFTLVGAKNVAGESEQWPSFTEESAIAFNPDVIITTDSYTPDVVKTLISLQGWENVNAIKNKDVYLLAMSNEINQPNQHVVSAMIEIAKDIYPDVYKDVKDPFAAK